MNKKQNRVLVVLAILALLAVVFGTRENQVPFTSDQEAGTGECGYIGNMGTLHRNGGVTPVDCSMPVMGHTIEVMRYEKYQPMIQGVPAQNDTVSAVSDPAKEELPATDDTKEENPVVDNQPKEDKPESPAVPDKDKKNKCNNGNGNGAEGCNASDKGNNDETAEKGDKAENHSDNNGNGNSH